MPPEASCRAADASAGSLSLVAADASRAAGERSWVAPGDARRLAGLTNLAAP